MVKEGDRFEGLGMKGRKVLSEYMRDRKFEYIEKKREDVLSDSKGEMMWVMGEGRCEKRKIRKRRKKILEVMMK